MDETILRLRKWQLERHITNDEQELNMFDLALSNEDCTDLTADTAESDNREQAIANNRLHHDFQISQSKEAVIKRSSSSTKVPLERICFFLTSTILRHALTSTSAGYDRIIVELSSLVKISRQFRGSLSTQRSGQSYLF
jgi:hypothetical protein